VVASEIQLGVMPSERPAAQNRTFVIMDISLPDLNGMDATMQIKRADSDVQIIVFTMHADREYVVRHAQGGHIRYVLKERLHNGPGPCHSSREAGGTLLRYRGIQSLA